MKALTITISRQYGSGGRAIAQQLSKDLNLDLISIAIFYVSKNGGIGIKTCIKFAG